MAFSVATYNVLAAAYALQRFYPRTPAHLLDISYRRSVLPKYLLGFGVDIICLQEVEAETFATLQQALSPSGFVGAFTQKTNGKPDGCATLARRDRAAWVGHTHLAYNDGLGEASSGHIALVASLRVDDRVLAIANTHLKWDPPTRPREAQIGMRQIDELIAARSRLGPDADGWIIAGDFNVTADSPVVTTLQSSGFQFSHVNASGPTCVANGEARMIDYLFADAALIASPMPIPPLADDTALPGVGEPSDHLPIRATFRWKTP